MSKKITNTEKNERMEWSLFGAAPQAIEAQEARGQVELIESSQLPREGLFGANRPAWEAMGIRILGEDTEQGDPLFVSVELPKGWGKRPTDHAMWSDLVDDQGRKRAGIFYKAAFYERKAHIVVRRRFAIEVDYERRDSSVMHVEDCGKIVFTSTEHPFEARDWNSRDRAEELSRGECIRWLDEHGYPDFDNPAKYWDVA